VLLNHDVVVTDGWLEMLIALTGARVYRAREGEPPGEPHLHGARQEPRPPGIGLVGPMSNYAAPPQLVENVPYHDIVIVDTGSTDRTIEIARSFGGPTSLISPGSTTLPRRLTRRPVISPSGSMPTMWWNRPNARN
jgi:hypothetical protein